MSDKTFNPGVALKFNSDDAASTVAIKGPAVGGSDFALRLPDSDGFGGWVITTNGSGELSFQPGTADLLAGGNTWTSLQTFGSAWVSLSATTPFGYGVGAGGSVTQLTDKTTGVIIHKPCGRIICASDSLADAASVSFIVTNTCVGTDDIVVAVHDDGGTGGAYLVWANAFFSGFFQMTIRNVSGGPLSEAIQLKFIVIKAAQS